MRGSVWIVLGVLALGACDKLPGKPAPAAPAPTPAVTAPPAPEATAPAEAAVTPEAAAAPAVAPAPMAAAAPYRFSPGDFPARERRIAALIANAESRDTLGETAGVASQGDYQRHRCASKACVDNAYAAEEAKLRKWEGADAIK